MDSPTPGNDVDDVSFREWLTGESHFTAAREPHASYAADVRPKSKSKSPSVVRSVPGSRSREGRDARQARTVSFDSASAGGSTSNQQLTSALANAREVERSASRDIRAISASGANMAPSERSRTSGSMFQWMRCMRAGRTDSDSECEHENLTPTPTSRRADAELTPTSKRAPTPITPESAPRVHPLTSKLIQRQSTLDALSRREPFSRVEGEVASASPRIDWCQRTPSAFLNSDMPFDPPRAHRTPMNTFANLSADTPECSVASASTPRSRSIG